MGADRCVLICRADCNAVPLRFLKRCGLYKAVDKTLNHAVNMPYSKYTGFIFFLFYN